MYVDFEQPGDLVEQLKALPRCADEHILVLLAEHHQRRLDEIVSAVAAAGLPMFGAVFPGVISGSDWYPRGAVVQTLDLLGDPLVADLSGASVTWLDAPPEVAQIDGPASALIFFDCLSPITSHFVTDIFRRYGNAMSYAGAGAGNARLDNVPCIFAHGRIFPNAAVMVLLRNSSEVAVRHGWTPYKGPFLATASVGNALLELDWQPALDVYRSALPPELAEVSSERLLHAVAPSYPLAIYSEGQEYVVRDPLRLRDDGALLFVSQVPENAQIYIVDSNPQQMMQAIRAALQDIRLPPGQAARACLTFDCFTRTLYLGERFAEELAFINQGVAKLAPKLTSEGVIAVGEIAGDGERALEIHNKTVVVDLVHG
jgi:hypothetical protein